MVRDGGGGELKGAGNCVVCELYLKSKCEHEIKIRKRPSYEEPRNNVPKWAYVSAGVFFVSQKLRKLSLLEVSKPHGLPWLISG